ncbi:hypothetical protein BS50DRAFT_641680 [Corynespora cassiicola Philippines]|uniref:Uncharacterized protein n=1 Tax=Corynespora cassiicola Philippines TaxID=1448308 RepID=A0A2T2MZA1_CORCC|nr:hypothetical protein BS50DRAFT_641680 [Corynespora cassiicola Philippines]
MVTYSMEPSTLKAVLHERRRLGTSRPVGHPDKEEGVGARYPERAPEYTTAERAGIVGVRDLTPSREESQGLVHRVPQDRHDEKGARDEEDHRDDVGDVSDAYSPGGRKDEVHVTTLINFL